MSLSLMTLAGTLQASPGRAYDPGLSTTQRGANAGLSSGLAAATVPVSTRKQFPSVAPWASSRSPIAAFSHLGRDLISGCMATLILNQDFKASKIAAKSPLPWVCLNVPISRIVTGPLRVPRNCSVGRPILEAWGMDGFEAIRGGGRRADQDNSW